jgi:dimethylhistidine N-methyltransferase
MREDLLQEITRSLTSPQKKLAPKFLYDERGSRIFEEICKLEAYYLTRAELEILEKHANEIVDLMGSAVQLIEPGSGSAQKVRTLLKIMDRPLSYLPIEISPEILKRSQEELESEFHNLEVIPCHEDFTSPHLNLDQYLNEKERKIIFFPGSTLGNFSPEEARELLRTFSSIVEHNGAIIVGLDRKKEVQRLELAYDDPEGVTASFNLNVLRHLNTILGTHFDKEKFYHRALYNETCGRVEMHLVSRVPQKILIGENWITFNEEETIHTESSYKYSVPDFEKLVKESGLVIRRWWSDSKELFCVYFLEPLHSTEL